MNPKVQFVSAKAMFCLFLIKYFINKLSFLFGETKIHPSIRSFPTSCTQEDSLLCSDECDQIYDTVAVTILIVIPRDKLDKVSIQRNACICIKNA